MGGECGGGIGDGRECGGGIGDGRGMWRGDRGWEENVEGG